MHYPRTIWKFIPGGFQRIEEDTPVAAGDVILFWSYSFINQDTDIAPTLFMVTEPGPVRNSKGVDILYLKAEEKLESDGKIHAFPQSGIYKFACSREQ